MKTAIQDVLDIIEMEHNNGVEISQRVLYKMLLDAKDKEKQQIIDAYAAGFEDVDAEQYFNETYNTK